MTDEASVPLLSGPAQGQPQPGYPIDQGDPYPPQSSYGGPTMQQTGYGGGAYPPPVIGQPGPDAAHPPPYTGGEQTVAQSNIVVIQPQTTHYQQPVNTSDGNGRFILALVVTVIAVVGGCWWALICSIPAIVISLRSQDAAGRGDYESVRKNRNISLGLSIAAIVSSVLAIVVLVLVLIIESLHQSNNKSN